MRASRVAKSWGWMAGRKRTVAVPGKTFWLPLRIMCGGALDDDGDHGGVGFGGEEEGALLEGEEVAVRERVPSGKMKMCMPERRASAAMATLCSASWREWPRETGTYFAMRMAMPTKGIFISDFLRKTLHMPGMAGRRMGGSRLETWLLRKMQDWLAGNVLGAFDDDSDAASADAGAHGEHGPGVHGADVADEEAVGDADEGGGQAEEGKDEEHA
jgi:hypothetical protein